MLAIRNRHYHSPTCQLLPWGDPYILQLFASEFSASQQIDSDEPFQVRYRRLRMEAFPPLGDHSPDFDLPRRRDMNWPTDESEDE